MVFSQPIRDNSRPQSPALGNLTNQQRPETFQTFLGIQKKAILRLRSFTEFCETTKLTMQLSTRMFYSKRKDIVIVPAHPAISDDEEEEDDDVAGPDFVPPTHNLDIPGPSDMGPSAKRKTARIPALPPPDYIETPFQYFTRYFGPEMVTHIPYATQRGINTTFTTNENEIITFLSILMYMGISELPAVEDYWALETRVPQVANLMPSKRFRLLKRVVHFNDNTELPGSIDRFFKVRPLFSFLNSAFRREPQTPEQSVDEVIVAYKGKTAGNRRQYPVFPLGLPLWGGAGEENVGNLK
ncbi:hypothetical protein JOQ06_023450 [Pogonophryne albipinna]|uniref:PiggyBac transposable element-derived protein domain-containing protein n=1 Tax=Pogonophryne albipinna TaxID=1090488 RepID=A0AAD6BKA7_9TELE|nr:hypothetical protein JOQ06_023450 [Pogonophryne albipinna]